MKAILVLVIIGFTTYQIISYATIRTEVLRGDVYQYEMYKVTIDNSTDIKYEYRKVIGVSDSTIYYITSSDNQNYDGQEHMYLNSFLIGGKRL